MPCKATTRHFSPSNPALSLSQGGDSSTGIPNILTIGPVFFEAFGNFPGSKYIFGLNLAQNGSHALSNALAEARAAVQYIGSDLESFEIGNEPNLYIEQGKRPNGYTQSDYVQQWLDYSTAVSEQVLIGNNASLQVWPMYQVLTYITLGDIPAVIRNWSTCVRLSS